MLKRAFSSSSSLMLSSMSPSIGSRKEPKRFYKEVTVTESFGHEAPNRVKMYEINLDKKKLKTPTGSLFQVDNEHLAHMISHEWLSQTNTIKQTTMHLTSLVNTCTDNPNKLTKESLIANICEYLHTDTLLYFDGGASINVRSDEKLDAMQEMKWRPLVDWFNTRFDTDLPIHKHIDTSPSTLGTE